MTSHSNRTLLEQTLIIHGAFMRYTLTSGRLATPYQQRNLDTLTTCEAANQSRGVIS